MSSVLASWRDEIRDREAVQCTEAAEQVLDRFAEYRVRKMKYLWIAIQIDHLVEIAVPRQRLNSDTMGAQHP